AAAQGQRLGGGAPFPRRRGRRGPTRARRQRAVCEPPRAGAGLQRIPEQDLSLARGRAVGKGPESAASFRRLALLQALSPQAARVLAARAGPLRRGRLRSEERRRSAIVDGAPARRGVRRLICVISGGPWPRGWSSRTP